MPDIVDIPLKVLNLPDLLCVKSITDLVKQLPDLLVGQAPTSITNVVVGNIQPFDTQRDTIWFRKDNAGNFLGIYVFSNGSWQQMYPVQNERFMVYRNPDDPVTIPPGYTRFDEMAGIDPTVVAAEMASWTADPVLPNEYLRFSIIFSGF